MKDATTQAGYVLADHPTWAAPPDAISQRLTGDPAPERTGAHAIHLTGSAFSRPFPCAVCHEVPATLSHVGGREARASVVVTAPGQAAPDPAAYEPATRTCATACHGASRSPAWELTGLECDGCHGVPPPTPVHGGLSGTDLTSCALCHPETMTASGALILPGGAHLNGMVDRTEGHPDPFVLASVHGPQYLDDLAGTPGASSCASCHGPSLGYCDACHSRPASGGWASWQTNCTFCHGTRTPAYAAASVTLSSPPDALSQRLTGVAVATRTGKHRQHLNGKPGYNAVPCATCHAVPTTAAHVSVDRRATVVFDPAAAFPTLTADELAALPDPLATYDPSGTTPRCGNNYCHGFTLAGRTTNGALYPPGWSTLAPGINSCTVCHGDPPRSGRLLAADGVYCADSCSIHYWHVQALPDAGYDTCTDCHTGSAAANTAKRHVNGRFDVVWGVRAIPPGPITGTWSPQGGRARTCPATRRRSSAAGASGASNGRAAAPGRSRGPCCPASARRDYGVRAQVPYRGLQS